MNSESDDGWERPGGAWLQDGGVSGTFMGKIVFCSMGKTLGQWEYKGQWEVRMVDDCTGRTKEKNNNSSDKPKDKPTS